jgi:hypothetical protein
LATTFAGIHFRITKEIRIRVAIGAITIDAMGVMDAMTATETDVEVIATTMVHGVA